jgi:hypothetical protein
VPGVHGPIWRRGHVDQQQLADESNHGSGWWTLKSLKQRYQLKERLFDCMWVWQVSKALDDDVENV